MKNVIKQLLTGKTDRKLVDDDQYQCKFKCSDLIFRNINTSLQHTIVNFKDASSTTVCAKIIHQSIVKTSYNSRHLYSFPLWIGRQNFEAVLCQVLMSLGY